MAPHGRRTDERRADDPWVPRKDRATYVIATLVGVLELPLLAVLALAALLTRAVAAAARAVLPQRRAETGGKA